MTDTNNLLDQLDQSCRTIAIARRNRLAAAWEDALDQLTGAALLADTEAMLTAAKSLRRAQRAITACRAQNGG